MPPLEPSNGLEHVAEVPMVGGTAAIKEQEPETVTDWQAPLKIVIVVADRCQSSVGYYSMQHAA